MRLVYERGSERVAFPIEEGETYIGRKDYCEIYFPDPSLSKRHARLVRRGSRLSVFDAGSRNGTLVNGEMVEESPLQSGDELLCGKLRFRVEGVPADAADREGYAFVGSGARRGSKSQDPWRAPVAKAVASGEARASMLDVLPELPASVERAGAPGKGSFSSMDGAPAALARFRQVEGGPDQTWDLTGETVTIGSKAENAICISGDGISRYHAEVVLEDGVWLLKDLGARNGIFVKGNRVDLYELKDRDEVQLGTCKLRFEIERGNPLGVAGEVLQRLLRDPVGTFKADQRVRLGLGVFLAAMVLLVFTVDPQRARNAFGGGGGDGHGPWLTEGSDQLIKGEYRAARDVFRKAKASLVTSEQQTPRVLEDVSELWMNLERGPLAFRWEKAGDVLRQTAKLKDLPPELRRWVNDQVSFTDLNLAAFHVLNDAEAQGTQAGGHAASKNLDAALDGYKAAIARAREVDASSLFQPRASELIQTLTRSAFVTITDDVQQRMSAQNPDWTACLRLLTRAVDFAENAEQRLELRRLSDRCERNRRDDALYMKAVEIVQARDVKRYPDAIAYLEQVDRNSRVYHDAQAYLNWIDADLKVRQAKRHYDIGDARRAMQLLAEALQHDVLGAAAIESVNSRRIQWMNVVRAYERGEQLLADGDLLQAEAEFGRVVQLEATSGNRYHTKARDSLKYIAKLRVLDLKKNMSNGLEALERRAWERALICFANVRNDPSHTAAELRLIREQVADLNQRSRLLSNAERDLLRDRTEQFLEIRDVFKLLYLWLPPEHPDRPKARKLLENVIERLKNWRRVR